MEFLHSFLRLHLAGKPLMTSWNINSFLRLCKGRVKVCHVSRAGFKSNTRGSLDYPKREAMNDSLINPKMVVIATVKYHNKSTMIKSCTPRVFWAFPLSWKVECFNCSTIKSPRRSAQISHAPTVSDKNSWDTSTQPPCFFASGTSHRPSNVVYRS